jgi:acetyl-CoA C-acetyltransferase
MAENIKDKIAIIGAGCSKFGELWDKDDRDLIIDACYEAFDDAGIEAKDIQAAWLSTVDGRNTGLTMAQALKVGHIPISRVENQCSSGTDAFRNACYAIASGVYDVALVCGVEKLKDTGQGLFGSPFELPFSSRVDPLAVHTPAAFEAMVATRYFHVNGLSYDEGKRLLAMIAVKNHHNGTLNPKAHLQREITLDQAINAKMICSPLGLYDCCGMTDGASAAILTRADIAKSFRDDYVLVKAVSLASGTGRLIDCDFITFKEVELASKLAYEDAGIKNPRKEIDFAEIHDAFTILELVFPECIGLSAKGKVGIDVEAGNFAIDGEFPINPDGGLKCCGHPLGATGVRMVYEVYKQIQGKAGAHQVKKAGTGLTLNMGGIPWSNASGIVILGCRD